MSDTPDSSYKAGFIAVMGRPNVGKSTLINALMGQKIAAVSPRPQTTRKRQLGILTRDNVQAIFVDTPGVHQAKHKLGENMNQEAIDTLEDSDLVLFVVDASEPPDDEDRLLAGHLAAMLRKIDVLLVLNKIDQIDEQTLAERSQAYQELAPDAVICPISANGGTNLKELTQEIIEHLPEGFPFYPEGQVTDLYEREIAADLIREACLLLLREEVPHGVAVRIDQYIERDEHGAYIEATIFVERDSHKGIVIGQGGMMSKKIGSAARKEIEKMSGRKVFLRLRVKVRKNWRNDEKVLRWFGF